MSVRPARKAIDWLWTVGLGRSDYRSTAGKVAAGRRKELAMRRVTGRV
ncbi:hypothetical protein FHX78_112362 [Streptomyces capillispiralis]|uniref:Uncharacterized protein n=1 Tax=Streptomyces capillispiralis TaxID=68182 RepID=A0A561TE68_9ACTN|nr:hypothetical protein FHX78_112362 [Streptomyces capillispiralis]